MGQDAAALPDAADQERERDGHDEEHLQAGDQGPARNHRGDLE